MATELTDGGQFQEGGASGDVSQGLPAFPGGAEAQTASLGAPVLEKDGTQLGRGPRHGTQVRHADVEPRVELPDANRLPLALSVTEGSLGQPGEQLLRRELLREHPGGLGDARLGRPESRVYQRRGVDLLSHQVLVLLFSAGQETLIVMTTAVTQQKRSAEWAHDLRQPFDKGNFQLINDLSSEKLGPVNAEQK